MPFPVLFQNLLVVHVLTTQNYFSANKEDIIEYRLNNNKDATTRWLFV